MGNGNHRNWAKVITESRYTPKFYIPTITELGLLGRCKVGRPEGKIERQQVSMGGGNIGFIQLGHGYGESYVVKPVGKIGEKLRFPKDKAILHLITNSASQISGRN